MKNFFTEFKAFALRGNTMDMVVAFIIGAAFGKIVSSLVDNIMMPVVSVFLGIVNLSVLQLRVGTAVVPYGMFLQHVADFLIVALCIFVCIQLLNKLKRAQDAKSETPAEEVLLLREIRDMLRNQRP